MELAHPQSAAPQPTPGEPASLLKRLGWFDWLYAAVLALGAAYALLLYRKVVFGELLKNELKIRMLSSMM